MDLIPEEGSSKMSGNKKIINKACPHTIKKFELIEKYVETWAQKLLQNDYCSGIVFIDCMCNSGEYTDNKGNQIFGTPVRVAKYLRDVSGQYPSKRIDLYFSDLCSKKTNHLASLLPKAKFNFQYHITCEDGNNLLKRLGKTLSKDTSKHFLLVYDPYNATIDWNAIMPYLNNWGEVIINHMISDSMRAVKTAKSLSAVSKYERTYMTEIDNLIPYGSNKDAYEKRIEDIIKALHRNKTRKYYIAAFPFFNAKNAIVYNLIHCTSNINGFKLYKQSAWQTFGGKSSTKDTHGKENQIILDIEGKGHITATDECCYYIKDVAAYLQSAFEGQNDVPLDKLWALLDEHPIFPSDGFRLQIKKELKQNYGAKETRGKMSFVSRGFTK